MANPGRKVASNTARKKGTWKVYDEAGELLKTQTFKEQSGRRANSSLQQTVCCAARSGVNTREAG